MGVPEKHPARKKIPETTRLVTESAGQAHWTAIELWQLTDVSALMLLIARPLPRRMLAEQELPYNNLQAALSFERLESRHWRTDSTNLKSTGGTQAEACCCADTRIDRAHVTCMTQLLRG